MRTEDICALPVKDLADKDAHLYLWTTNAAFPEALTVIRAWGFKYITCITWVKNTVGFAASVLEERAEEGKGKRDKREV